MVEQMGSGGHWCGGILSGSSHDTTGDMMPQPSENLSALERRLAEHVLAFVLLNQAWRHGFTAIERREIGRHRETQPN